MVCWRVRLSRPKWEGLYRRVSGRVLRIPLCAEMLMVVRWEQMSGRMVRHGMNTWKCLPLPLSAGGR